ncbi:MBL fold metallo-hydrolase [Deinococcus maricopensis]|uniref:Beta-lactamase domain protein n=1 Tax=Deinococcus maricopensis (strain DSM 21211 / LMG 22137 / NRRL B-23946 / LB-34) TaxID=709986 RepID=E8UC15_DEIML|nr:MBL fold metallo-hydrolase [Deinococcus maricopensis]ADV68676.1 beta-lactamase domain protein [Deinococcus maricopensis DSM 21211]
MTELVQLGAGAWAFLGAVNSGVLEDGVGGALIVDTGLDESHARKLLRAVASAGLTPRAVLNTHAHADHIGGNAFIVARFPNVEVFAPPVEDALIRHPELAPRVLFGARPPAALRGKFLLAPASPAVPLGAGEVTLAGVPVELRSVPGHAGAQVAVQFGEVLYAADALFGASALAKHPLTFCVDSAAQKASAAALGALAGVGVVLPGHGAPVPDVADLARVNLAAYARTTDAVRAAVQTPCTTDEALARVADAFGVVMRDMAGVVLNRAVVSAHLVELQEAGAVHADVRANRLVWVGA